MTATTGFRFNGSFGVGRGASFGGAPIFSAGPTASQGVIEGSIGAALGGDVVIGPGAGTADAGVVAGVGGQLRVLEASFGAVFPRGDSRHGACIKTDAAWTRELNLTAKAWLGSWDLTQTVTFDFLRGKTQYGNTPFYWPRDCTKLPAQGSGGGDPPGPGDPGGPGSRGDTWQAPFSPAPAQSRFEDVACVSSTDCFAVGAAGAVPNDTPLVMRRSGSAWTQVASSAPAGASGADLRGIACTSANTCMAIGEATIAGTRVSFASRWDGASWTPTTLPSPPSAFDVRIRSVACTSATACLAVGASNVGGVVGGGTPYAARWDGSSWTLISPGFAPASDSNVMTGVSCITVNDCAAVGYRAIFGSGYVPYTWRWNGTSWAGQSESIPTGGKEAYFSDVSCTSSSFCKAVGRYFDATSGSERMMFQQGNGSTWSVQPVAHPADLDIAYLQSVSCPSATSCAAVGPSAGGGVTVRVHGVS